MTSTPTGLRSRNVSLLIAVAALLSLVGARPASASTGLSAQAPAIAPAVEETGTFNEMTGVVKSAMRDTVVVEFFATGFVTGVGHDIYGSSLELSRSKTTVINVKSTSSRKGLRVLRPGMLVRVDGHITKTDGSPMICIGYSCSGGSSTSIRYVIDTITDLQGRCGESQTIRLKTPWSPNKRTRLSICVAGSQGWADLTEWDRVSTAATSFTVNGEKFDLALDKDTTATFSLRSALSNRTSITGTVSIDVESDGKGPTITKLRAMGL